MTVVRNLGGKFAAFDEMCWELPGDYMNDVEWTLRYGTPTREQLVYAASVISSYRQMVVVDTATKRARVIRALRQALGKTEVQK